VWKDSRVIASYIAGASVLYALVQAVLTTSFAKNLRSKYLGYEQISNSTLDEDVPFGWKGHLNAHIKAHGGTVIFVFQVVRLVVAGALFVLSLGTMIVSRSYEWANIAFVSTIVSICVPSYIYHPLTIHAGLCYYYGIVECDSACWACP
jgi:hypothetical protein